MSGPLRHNRNTRDANERELVQTAERLGACWREAPPLDGLCWVPRLGKWMPVEIKLPEREGLSGEYTPAQRQFLAWCERNHAPHWVWRTIQDVMRDLGVANI
jgi:hypothetical protein